MLITLQVAVGLVIAGASAYFGFVSGDALNRTYRFSFPFVALFQIAAMIVLNSVASLGGGTSDDWLIRSHISQQPTALLISVTSALIGAFWAKISGSRSVR